MASLLEIFIIPVLFVLVERISHHFKKKSPDDEGMHSSGHENSGGTE